MPTPLISEPWEVNARLEGLCVTRGQMMQALEACVAAYAGCTENDPPTARGYRVWQMGTRRLREVLAADGWERDDQGGYSSVVNHEAKLRIVVMNTDEGTGSEHLNPQNRSRKGPTSRRVAEANQLAFPAAAEWPVVVKLGTKSVVEDDYVTWHLCVHIDNDTVRAELCILVDFEDGFFRDCRDRILLIGPEDNDFLDPGADIDDLGPDFEIEVRRK